jgi:hypothetical protein
MLTYGEPIPTWFSFPGIDIIFILASVVILSFTEVVKILQESFPPRFKKGFTIFFTGLSGAGTL